MNKYEMMFIVKTTIDEEAVKATAENLKSVITSMKGEITDSKELGNKKIAYPIKKEITGYYWIIFLKIRIQRLSSFYFSNALIIIDAFYKRK